MLGFNPISTGPLSYESGNQTKILVGTLFSNSNTFYSHTITQGGAHLTATLFANSNTFYTAALSHNLTLRPSIFNIESGIPRSRVTNA
jgi:hypothetical protein